MRKLSVEEQKEFWRKKSILLDNELAKVMWTERPPWNKYVYELYLYYLRDHVMEIRPSDVVLDVGCGVGLFTFKFANFANRTYGIDIVKENVEYAKKKAEGDSYTNVEFQAMDVRALGFHDCSFDKVFSVAVLMLLSNEDNLRQAIRELLRVTKESGKIFLIEDTSTWRCDPIAVGLPRKKWFKIIEEEGGKVVSWSGVSIPVLRNILNLVFYAFRLFTRRESWRGLSTEEIVEKYSEMNENKKRLENYFMTLLTSLLKPLEYTIPKWLKSQSSYTLVVISK